MSSRLRPPQTSVIRLSLAAAGETRYQTIRHDLALEEAAKIKDVAPEVIEGALTLIRPFTIAARARLGI
jgi:hypothetical protein